MSLKHLILPITLIAALAFSGCEKKPAAPAPGPLEVGVITVAPQPLTLTTELPGRTSAYRIAEVRARVSGIVQKRLFVEGGTVQAGQLLYQIDPAPYQAALDSAKATLARAQASATSARLQHERYTQLIQARAISQQDFDNALATFQSAEADVASAQAAIKTAEINLGYTAVTSPITGRIGLSQVTEGAYVQDSAATLLATVQQLDPLYVDLTQSSSDLLRLKHDIANGRLQSAGKNATKVELLLDNDRPYEQDGSLEFSDVTIDTSTNSVTIRALFPNPKGELLPGLFVRARLVEGASQAGGPGGSHRAATTASIIPVNHANRRRLVIIVRGLKVEVEVDGRARDKTRPWWHWYPAGSIPPPCR